MVQEKESVLDSSEDDPSLDNNGKTTTGCLDLPLGLTARSALAAISALEKDSVHAESITSVVVRNNSKSQSRVTPKELIAIFEGISKHCHRLEDFKVNFDTIASPGLALPTAALVAFFQQKPACLKTVHLSASFEAEDAYELVQLEEAVRLYAPESWRELSLEFCEPAIGTPSLDPIVSALAVASSLEQVKFSGTSMTRAGICTGSSLEKFLRSGRLKVLTLWGGKRKVRSEHICALAKAVENNRSLRELTIHASNLCPEAGRALAQCLVRNTSLERLVLNIHDSPSTSTHSDYVNTTTMIAQALKRHNRTLKYLSLDYDSSGEMEEVGDSRDRDFHDYDQIHKVTSWWHVHAIIQAFTQMLHCNPVIEVLWMNHANAYIASPGKQQGNEDADSTVLLTSEMAMLLRLNRYGIRRNLFDKDNSTAKDWVDALASQRGDLNALYYLVSRNPSLCCNLPDCAENNNGKGTKRRAPFGEDETRRLSKKRQRTITVTA